MAINIGKAVLYQMLGVQRNHKANIFQDIDIAASGCNSCSWYKIASVNHSSSTHADILKHCASCPNRQQAIYINEKNKYGDKKPICRSAILLFILLHTYNPDQTGFIKSIYIDNLADTLKVSHKTVRNNLMTLRENGYIYYQYIGESAYCVILQDYASYYLPAAKGGRGYVKLANEVLSSLISVKSILALRILLRNLLDGNGTDNIKKTYRELRYSLPAYCKRSVILNKLQNIKNDIFDIQADKKSIIFKLNKTFNINHIMRKEKEEYTQYFTSLLKQHDDFVMSYDKYAIPNQLKRFFTDDSGNLIDDPVVFQTTGAKDLINDLATMSCKYSKEIVTNALADTYRAHMCKQQGLIKDLGNYISKVIQNYDYDKSSISQISKPAANLVIA